MLSAASQQYGGFTVPEVDKILAPYAEKTYQSAVEKYIGLGIEQKKAEEVAVADVEPFPVKLSQSGYIVFAEHRTPASNTSSSGFPGP